MCDRKSEETNRKKKEDDRIFVIGIGGPSGGGKSALTVFLRYRFSAHCSPHPILHLDHYFRPEQTLLHRSSTAFQQNGEPIHFRNIEFPQAIDFPRLQQDLHTRIQHEKQYCLEQELKGGTIGYPRLIFIEGFLLFSSPPSLLQLLNVSIFVYASSEECRLRRFHRTKTTNALTTPPSSPRLRSTQAPSPKQAESPAISSSSPPQSSSSSSSSSSSCTSKPFILQSCDMDEKEFRAFFNEVIWPHYLEHNAHILSHLDSKYSIHSQDTNGFHKNNNNSTSTLIPKACEQECMSIDNNIHGIDSCHSCLHRVVLPFQNHKYPNDILTICSEEPANINYRAAVAYIAQLDHRLSHVLSRWFDVKADSQGNSETQNHDCDKSKRNECSSSNIILFTCEERQELRHHISALELASSDPSQSSSPIKINNTANCDDMELLTLYCLSTRRHFKKSSPSK